MVDIFLNSIPDDGSPIGIAFDPNNGNLYVTGGSSGSISVIAPTHVTTLTLNPIATVQSSTSITATGKLTDNNASNAGIGGKTITFSGTGAGNLISAITNPDGTFSATCTSPDTVATGWTCTFCWR